MDAPPALVLVLSDAVRQLFTARYLSLAGLSVLSYDLILTAPDELSIIWPSELRFGKALRAAFLFNRYGMMATTILYLCVVSFPVADFTSKWCIGSGAVVLYQSLLVSVCGEGLVIYVLCCSWNWRRGLTWSLIAGWTLVVLASIISFALCIEQFSENNSLTFVHLGRIRTCDVTHVPSEYVRAFYGNTAMELYIISFFVFNALSRPRTVSQGLFGMLVNDGLFFFLITLPSKIANLIVMSKAPASIAIIFPILTMALISTATGRLYLRFCTASQQLRDLEVMEERRVKILI